MVLNPYLGGGKNNFIKSLFSIYMECGQVVRHLFLVQKIKGSNPFTPMEGLSLIREGNENIFKIKGKQPRGLITQLVRVYA